MERKFMLSIIAGSFSLSIIHLIFDRILGLSFSINGFAWGILANILVVGVLAFYIKFSTLKGIQLIIATFIIYFIIGYFNILIEAYIFNVTDRSVTLQQILRGLLATTIFCPLLVWIVQASKVSEITLTFKHRSYLSWGWRIIAGMFLYLFFYLAAGMILQATYPDLMNFYQDKIPPISVILLTQFPRGLFFAGIAILILRTTNLSIIQKAILIGLTFSIIGGIAPLITPNEYMPSNIRWVHGIEVGISNFLYGLVLGFLLGQKK